MPGGHRVNRDDALAEAVVGRADDHRVTHGRVVLQCGFDFLRIHLFAARVDAHGAAAEQMDRSVGIDRGHVARQRPSLAVDLYESARAAIGVLVVAERDPAARGEPADDAPAGFDRS